MNDPTLVAKQVQRRISAAGKRGGMMTTTRRCACVTALSLLFLVLGFGGVRSETRAQDSLTMEHGVFDHGLTLPTVGEPASANTLAGVDQKLVDEHDYYWGMVSTRARYETH
jgi:hypothetical protein